MMFPMAETYLELMTDGPHLAFEMTLTLIQDVVIGMLAWPMIKRAVRRHDEKKHGKGSDILIYGSWNPETKVFVPDEWVKENA